jgi:hypothetical protein
MLKLNVGVTKKNGLPNYRSCGAAVHLEAEVESLLLDRPDDLHARIRELFGLATVAVEAQLRASLRTADREAVVHRGFRDDHRRATARQIQALLSLAARRHRDPSELATEYGIVDLAQLSVVEASRLIARLQRAVDEESAPRADSHSSSDAAA